MTISAADKKQAHLQTLMQSALGGDKRAYGQALQEVSRLLRPYLARRLFRKDEVEDVLQEILTSIHKARHTYDGKRPFLPWVFGIARYRLSDHLRAHYADNLHKASPLEDAEKIMAEDVTETGFSYESIKKAIDALPEKQAKILEYMHRHGYTAKETAKKMGMKESAVKVAAHRAYKVLRKTLNE